MLSCDFLELMPRHWRFEHYLQKFVSCCAEYCVKSHKDRVVIVSHDLISIIYRLVLTTHLEDEFGLELQLHLTPGLLDSEAATHHLLHPLRIPIHEYGDSENQVI